MKILFIITQSEIGGAQRFLLEFAPYLANKGHKISVVTGEGDGELPKQLVSSIEYLVSSTETAEALSSRLADIGADLLIETIPKWINGKIESKEQDHKKATYSKIITKEDGRIDWNKSAEEIERQIRAFTPWPGSYTFWDDKRINIIKGTLATDSDILFNSQSLSGQVALYEGGKFAVKTGAGLFVVSEVQIAGKDKINSRQFLNGYSDIIGSVLK